MNDFECPKCSEPMEIDTRMAGRQVRGVQCDKLVKLVRVPEPEAADEMPRDDGVDPRPARWTSAVRFLLVAAAVVLYLLACGSEVMFVHYSQPPIYGISILLTGWLGPLFGVVAWYANPLFLIALILFLCRRDRPSCYFAVAALAIGSTSLLMTEWHHMGGHGGGSRPIHAWGPGMWLWLGSLALVAASALMFWSCGVGLGSRAGKTRARSPGELGR